MYAWSGFSASLPAFNMVIFFLKSDWWAVVFLFGFTSLMSNDVEHFVMYFLVICISTSVKYLFISILQLPIVNFLWVNLLACLNVDCSLYIPDAMPLSDIWFPNIVSQSLKRMKIQATESYPEQHFSFQRGPNYLFFILWIVFLVSSLKTICLTLYPEDPLVCFLLKVI